MSRKLEYEYAEVQIHGGVTLADVEKVIVHLEGASPYYSADDLPVIRACHDKGIEVTDEYGHRL